MRVIDGPREGARAVVVTHLHMLDATHLNASPPVLDSHLVRIEEGKSSHSRWFYRYVGADWNWVDRLNWTDDQWQRWTERAEHHLFTLDHRGEPAGYVELEQQPGGDVEIAYLGLLPGRSGHGLGGWLLTSALSQAWRLSDTERVWVHTCDLDSPAALRNYRARGMSDFARTIEWRVDAPDTVTP